MDIDKIRKIPVGIRQDIRDRLLSQEFSNKYCQKCGLYKGKMNPYIIGRGDRDANVLIIGEHINQSEEKKGQTFIEGPGVILQNVLNRNHISYYLTNAVRCHPTKDGKSKTPTPTEIKCCTPFTIKLIRELKPKVIVTLGKIATKQLLPINLTMKIARGKQFYHPELGVTIIPTYNPKYLGMAKDTLLYKQFEQDMILANQIASLPPKRLIKAKPRTLSVPHEIEEYLRYLLTTEAVAIDLETEGVDYQKDAITDISFCAKIGEGVHVAWDDMEPHFELLGELLSSEKIMKFGHNFKFDMLFFRAMGFKIKKYGFDTLLAEHTHTMSLEGREVTGMYKLETLTWQYTDIGGYEQLLGKGGIVAAQKKPRTKAAKKRRSEEIGSLDDIKELDEEKDPIELYNEELDSYAGFIENARKKKALDAGFDLEDAVPYYSALDADSTYRIYQKQKYIIDTYYKELFYEIIIPLSYALMVMEENGLKLDLEYMNQIYEENLASMNLAKEKLFKAVGKEFDIQSNPQLKDVVFNILKVKKSEDFKTAKGDYSLDATAMEYYGSKNKDLQNVLDYRKFQKQSSTYITGFKKFMNPTTHRVHSSYQQYTTATGRLSVWSPPVQTIPKDNRIRNMVIASEGCKLIVADLSQIELRILAMLSRDPNMLDAFNSGIDFHSATACKMFKISFSNFDKENPEHDSARSAAKCVHPSSIIVHNHTLTRIGDIVTNVEEDTFEAKSGDVWSGNNFVQLKSTYKSKPGKRILISAHRSILVCSENHRVQLKNGSLKRARDIQKDDVLCDVSFPELVSVPQYIKINPFNGDDDKGLTLWLNEKWAYVAGVYTGDGCYAEKHINISTGDGGEYEVWKDVLVKAFDDVGIEAVKRPPKKCLKTGNLIKGAKVYVGSTRTRRFFDKLGLNKPDGGKSFRIPLWVLNNDENCWSFLGGLLDTDGIVTRNPNSRTLSITTKSWELMQDLTVLLNRLKIEYGIENTFNKTHKRYYFRLQIYVRSTEKLYDKNVMRCSYKVERLKQKIETIKQRKRSNHNKDNFVKRVECLDEGELVDIEVGSENHLYWVNNIISHNSINFGIVYGIGPGAIAASLEIPYGEAVEYIETFHRAYPRVRVWMDHMLVRARQLGYVETLYGRRRYLPMLHSSNSGDRSKAERQVINTAVQSSAGDVNNLAIIRIQKYLEEESYKALIAGSVHDSIITDTPDPEIDEVSEIMINYMTTNIPKITVPLKVDLKVEEKWTK